MQATRNIAAVFVVILMIIGIIGFLVISQHKKTNNFSLQPSPTSSAQVLPSATLSPSVTNVSSPSTSSSTVSEIKVYLVALNDNGQTGTKIGCGDSLVPVTFQITPTQAPLRSALEKLFSIKQQYYGQSGLYNSLYQSNLSIQNLSIDSSGVAHIQLTGTHQLGGECDDPRFKAQIEQTALQFPTVKSTDVTINGESLDQIVSGK